jgi:predicted enzyme related to lactoylglutathione lyase
VDFVSADTPKPGTIAWHDLTVGDAGPLREFYSHVVGWRSEAVDMGGYEDWCMVTPTSGETVAGVCHARGTNASLPPQWLMYVIVADVESSARTCVELGGTVLVPVRGLMGGRFCVIQDPAGAVLALFQPGT